MAYGPWKGQRWRTVWNNGYYRIDVKWDFCQDVENNKTMTAMCGQRVASLNGYYSFNYTACETGVGDFNGTKFPETRAVSVGGGGTTEIECTHRHSEVTHNADGSWPSGQVCGWWRFNVPLASHNVPTVGWTAFNIDGEIPTIPRATTPTLSASSVAMGSAVTINLPRASSAFTHNVTYRFGSATGTINSNAGTSCSWTPPVSLAQQIKTSTSGVGTITVQTKNGSTVIGTKTINITLTVPASVAPTISGHVVAEATANIASKFGAFVQSKSTLKVTTTAAGAQGSTITAYKTVIEGRSYTGSPCTSAAISGSGTIAVKTTVTDSRGRTATKTTNVTVVAYSPPQISVSNVARTSDEATTGTCTYNYSISSVGSKNDKAFYIQYLNGSTWTDIVRMSTDYSKSGSQTTGAIFGVDATTKVRFVAQDYFTSVIVEKEVGPTFTLMNFGAGGKSLAIGMLSANDGYFEVGLPFRLGGRQSYAQPGKLLFNDTSMGSGAFCRTVFEAYRSNGGAFVPVHFMCPKAWSPTGADIWMFGECGFQNGPHNTQYAETLVGRFWDRQGREWLGMWIKTKLDETANPWGHMKVTWTSAVLAFFPVGAVYLTYTNTNPGTIMGGTWVQFSQGRVLLGQGTGSDGSTSMIFGAASTGGEYKHKLAQSEMPSHSHWLSDDANHTAHSFAWGGAGKTVWLNTLAAGGNGSGNVANTKQHEWNHTAYDGGNGLHNNVQPYQVIYAWRRTA